MAMTGADVRYQAGCHSIYRRYGAVTVSTTDRQRWLENHQRILEKAEERLQQTGCLTEAYRQALARSYFQVARNYFDVQRDRYQAIMQKVFKLDPSLSPQQSKIFDMAWRLLGPKTAEALASMKRKAARKMLPSQAPL